MSKPLVLVAVLGLTVMACSAKEDDAVSQSAIQPMLGAVMHSETEKVKRLAEQRVGLDERNPADQSTPILNAARTDQWPVAEILLDHGANIWLHDEFGDTAATYTLDSRILRGSDEDKARLRVIEKLKARGYPFPPPNPDEVLALEQRGEWPPHRQQRP